MFWTPSRFFQRLLLQILMVFFLFSVNISLYTGYSKHVLDSFILKQNTSFWLSILFQLQPFISPPFSKRPVCASSPSIHALTYSSLAPVVTTLVQLFLISSLQPLSCQYHWAFFLLLFFLASRTPHSTGLSFASLAAASPSPTLIFSPLLNF